MKLTVNGPAMMMMMLNAVIRDGVLTTGWPKKVSHYTELSTDRIKSYQSSPMKLEIFSFILRRIK